MNKVDTSEGLTSVRGAADFHVPYAMLLYERYLGRPFASHRDPVSELVGDVMESAVEAQLTAQGVSYRKTKRAESVPDEYSPAVVIEAKITNDDGSVWREASAALRSSPASTAAASASGAQTCAG